MSLVPLTQGTTATKTSRDGFGLSCRDFSLSGTTLNARRDDGHGGLKLPSINTSQFLEQFSLPGIEADCA